MSYKLYYEGLELRFKNKDDLMFQLAIWLSGDGVTPIKIIYPDGWALIE